jgi:competence protein ComEC
MNGFLFLSLLQPALAGELVVTLLDVGQGDAVLLETPGGATILVDAGLAKSQTPRQLKAFGVEHLDLVVASHPHADHIGGMAAVLSAYPPDLFWYSGMDHTTQAWAKVTAALDDLQIETVAVQRGDRLTYDDVTLSVLWPGERLLTGTRSDLNSNSVVLRVDHGDDCLLLTGDAEEVTEVQLLRQGLESCEVLKVAHHGSGHSTSQAWIDAVQPQIALISAGQDNRYHHPSPETMARLLNSEAVVYRTDLTGTVQLSSGGDGWEVTDGLPWDAPLDPAEVVVAVPDPVDSGEPVPAGVVPAPTVEQGRKRWLRRLFERWSAPDAPGDTAGPDN